MGLFFTTLFIFTAYLSPQIVFGNLSLYHIEIVIAILALVFSVFSGGGSGIFRMPQTYAIVGLSAAVALSIIFSGWLGGAPIALLEFLPNAMVFFFIVANVKKPIHLKILLLVLFGAALFIIVQGHYAAQTEYGYQPYLLRQRLNDDGDRLSRIRGMSFLNDPNDLAQVLVGLIPLMFVFWRKRNFIFNFFLTVVPVSVLLYGLFLTRSRGGLLALVVGTALASRRKIGTWPAILTGAVLLVGLTAAGFSGGRDVSAGDDRMSAWSEGLVLVRQHPLFGVGFNKFADHYEITAHNSVVVCAAELGLLGLICWLTLIIPTVRDAVKSSELGKKLKKVKSDGTRGRFGLRSYGGITAVEPASIPSYRSAVLATPGAEGALLRTAVQRGGNRFDGSSEDSAGLGKTAISYAPQFIDPMVEAGRPTEEEMRRMSGLVVLSMAAYLTAGWFLSRSYTMTLFVEAGIAGAVYRMARDRGTAARMWRLGYALKVSALTSLGLIVFLYIFLRVRQALGI